MRNLLPKFTKRQWLTLIIIGLADFGNAICVSLQAPFFPQEVSFRWIIEIDMPTAFLSFHVFHKIIIFNRSKNSFRLFSLEIMRIWIFAFAYDIMLRYYEEILKKSLMKSAKIWNEPLWSMENLKATILFSFDKCLAVFYSP